MNKKEPDVGESIEFLKKSFAYRCLISGQWREIFELCEHEKWPWYRRLLAFFLIPSCIRQVPKELPRLEYHLFVVYNYKSDELVDAQRKWMDHTLVMANFDAIHLDGEYHLYIATKRLQYIKSALRKKLKAK